MIAPGLQSLAHPVDGLQLLPGNPRRGDVDAVARSLERFGQRKPIVARRDGTVVAGNHTLQAVQRLGWPEIAVVWVDDDDATAKAFALADNRTAELGGYDDEALAAMVSEVGAVDMELLGAAGYSEADLEALVGKVQAVPPVTGDPDDVPDPPTEPVSVLGDLWILGPHRLLCGDSTNPDDVDRVLADLGDPGIVYTDPPYGISIVSGSKVGGRGVFGGVKNRGKVGGGKVVPASDYLPVAGDDTTDAAADAFRLLFTAYPAARHVWWGGNHYAASAGLPDSSCWLVWDKENTGNFADAELAWTNHPGAVRVLRHMWNGMLRASERGKRVHPTQKPVALAEWAFGVVDPDGKRRTVLDVFGGSGSTLIAAHITGRASGVVEMEAAYVDVICHRFQQATGIKPERVLEDGTTEPHDFTGS